MCVCVAQLSIERAYYMRVFVFVVVGGGGVEHCEFCTNPNSVLHFGEVDEGVAARHLCLLLL